MREFFVEGDLIAAEVQNVGTFDGKIQLQTRNEKYGRLAHGFLLSIDSNFIKRQKNHFVDFFGQPTIGSIIGTNGYVWIYAKG